jgi:phosphoglycolate phosphatase (TIGR01487 family)
MRYHVLACDYDGTLAHDGKIAPATLAQLQSLLSTGRKLILVTGRELDDLLQVLVEIKLFHRVVAENGALLYDPASGQKKALSQPLPESFTELLHEHDGLQLAAGLAIVSVDRSHELKISALIRELGLELQLIANRDRLMVLPAGVNKATGLAAALESLGLSIHEVVAVGDAENDHAFLDVSEFSVAVANALPALKEHADWVTSDSNGAGVAELIDEIIANDLQPHESQHRRSLILGIGDDRNEVQLSPRGPNILIAGPSGAGKSTVAASFLERLIEAEYQFCVIDPEGDYEGVEGTVTLGRGGRSPMPDEVVEVLAKPKQNVIVSLFGLPVTERPTFFLELLPRLHDMRTHTGRPHWLIIDEAHHLLPASWEPNAAAVESLQRTVFITVHPDQILPTALRSVGIVLAVGKTTRETFLQFAKPLKIVPPSWEARESKDGVAVLWPLDARGEPYEVQIVPSRIERQRHMRKYALGELPPDRSFYFRGPEQRLNLRAQNLQIFLQLAEGVDEDTWLHHLHRGDYSRWFRLRIKDEQLAREAEEIERQQGISAVESLEAMRELIDRYYVPSTAPAMPVPGTDAE